VSNRFPDLDEIAEPSLGLSLRVDAPRVREGRRRERAHDGLLGFALPFEGAAIALERARVVIEHEGSPAGIDVTRDDGTSGMAERRDLGADGERPTAHLGEVLLAREARERKRERRRGQHDRLAFGRARLTLGIPNHGLGDPEARPVMALRWPDAQRHEQAELARERYESSDVEARIARAEIDLSRRS